MDSDGSTSEAIPAMRARLPKYGVSGLLATGYDILEVITDLDEDSLQEIQQLKGSGKKGY